MKHVAPVDFAEAEPLRQDKPRPKHYLPPTDRLDLVTAAALDAGLTPAARRVLAVIVAHYSQHEGVARPGEDRIAELLGLARPVVSAAVKLLAECGWLAVERTRNGNRNGGNRYRLPVGKARPMLDAAGLNVTKTGHSEALSVTVSEPESHVSERLNVTVSCVSASPKHDHNPATEPRKRTQQANASGARARELPGSLSREEDRRRPQADKVPFPVDYAFPAETIAAARAKGLSDADIERARQDYRKVVGADLRTRDHLYKAGAAYLAKREAKPNPDEIVTIRGGALELDRRCRRSQVKPWESYTDSKGVQHPARNPSRPPLM